MLDTLYKHAVEQHAHAIVAIKKMFYQATKTQIKTSDIDDKNKDLILSVIRANLTEKQMSGWLMYAILTAPDNKVP